MKKVLVIGGTGFTGGYLVEKLESSGYDVFYTRYKSKKCGKNSLFLDLANPNSFKNVLSKTNPNIIYHLAGISSPGHNNETEFYKINTIGTLNLLLSLSELKDDLRLERLIVSSSASVYGKQISTKLTEGQKPNPIDHYGISKYLAEKLRPAFPDIPMVFVRAFNYTGVGQSQNFLIPKLVSAFVNCDPEIVLGNIEVRRDFSDVRDITRYFLRLASTDQMPDVINFCSGSSYSINEILKELSNIHGYSPSIRVAENLKRKNEVWELVGCNKVLSEAIGVRRLYSLRDTLNWMSCVKS